MSNAVSASVSNIDLLRGNRGLPSAAQQSMVVVRFSKATPLPMVLRNEFLRIKLYPGQLKDGEPLKQLQQRVKPIGVLSVSVPHDAVLNPEAVEAEQEVSRIHLVLDRRYSVSVLEAVYRTAGALAEQFGVRVL